LQKHKNNVPNNEEKQLLKPIVKKRSINKYKDLPEFLNNSKNYLKNFNAKKLFRGSSNVCDCHTQYFDYYLLRYYAISKCEWKDLCQIRPR
tara:strand:- start:330 stop:602 length:273 start_codon:yes stop_codon:yes gene_type:complete